MQKSKERLGISNGKWQPPKSRNEIEIINPATEEKTAVITLGNKEDVDNAVMSAKKAYQSWAFSQKEERIKPVSYTHLTLPTKA